MTSDKPSPLAPPPAAPIGRILQAARVDLKQLRLVARTEQSLHYGGTDPISLEFRRWCADTIEQAERYNDRLKPPGG